MPSERLRSFERVRRRPEFERIYSEGVKLRGRFMTLFLFPNAKDTPRMGVAATRKLGSAVIRNRAKRLARELFRRHKPSAGLDLVVVPRLEMLDAPFTSLEEDFDRMLRRRMAGASVSDGPGRSRRSSPVSRPV